MDKNTQRLNKHVIGVIILLVIQYVLGMAINLYVQFPEGASVRQNWEFMQGQWLVWAHIVAGTLIVLGLISLYIQAVKLKDKVWKITGGIAAVSSIVAWAFGEEFISRQNDFYSFAMSVFFIAALVSLCVGLYKARKY